MYCIGAGSLADATTTIENSIAPVCLSRSTTAESALETIYDLAGVKPPVESGEIFRGHPLAVAPKGAAVVFYGIWPAAIVAGAFFIRRKR